MAKKKYDNAAEGWTPDDEEPEDKDLLSDGGDLIDTLFLDEDGEISWGKLITYAIIGMIIAIFLNWDTIKKERSIITFTPTETTTTAVTL